MSRDERRYIHEGIFEVNMTPLIDVSLVLVVILMVATPLAFQSSIALHTAASGARAPRLAGQGWVELALSTDGTVRVNRQVVPREALGTSLRPLLARSASRLVVVRCEDGVSHGSFVQALDTAK